MFLEANFSEPSLQAIALAFGFGFLTSFTPCVYPLIPVTMSLFGADDQSSPRRRVTRATLYVAGMSSMFSLLGFVSARSGIIFGSFLANPFVVILLSAVLIFLALSSLDVVDFPGLHWARQRACNVGGRSPSGAFFMGSVMGLVAAPCVGPALAALLLVAAKATQAWWGALLLLSYALGLGVLFFALALSSRLLGILPKAGSWFYAIKYLIATALLLVACSLAIPLIKDQVAFILNWPSMYFSALLAGFAILSIFTFKGANGTKKVISSSGLALSLFLVLLPPIQLPLENQIGSASTQELNWINNVELAFATQQKESKILMVDTYADWCVACKELDRITFKDPGVKNNLRNFVLAKVNYEQEEQFISSNGIVGLPAVLFFDSTGKEFTAARINGYLSPEQFNQHLQQHGLNE